MWSCEIDNFKGNNTKIQINNSMYVHTWKRHDRKKVEKTEIFVIDDRNITEKMGKLRNEW